MFQNFPTSEAKRLAVGVLRNANERGSEVERRRLARAYLALFLPETAIDQLKKSTTASEPILNEMVWAEGQRQVASFQNRASDLLSELTKLRYGNPTNFESVATWLVAGSKAGEGSAKVPGTVVGVDISRTWLETIWHDEDAVNKLVGLKVALEWMQASLAGCAEVRAVVNPTAKDKISCHLTLTEVLAVGQPPKKIDCGSLSDFLSSADNLWTTQGKDRELRKTLESVLLETHLNLIE